MSLKDTLEKTDAEFQLMLTWIKGDAPNDIDFLTTLYRRALTADNAYQEALVVKYGARAADKRYEMRHEDEELNRLKGRFQQACESWLEAVRESRSRVRECLK